MLAKLFQSWADDNYHSNACRQVIARHAMKDLIGNKRNSELEKQLTDMITFADNFNLLKSSGEPIMIDLHHEVTFHRNNSFTVRKLTI